jgi:creatinine amidohydrolase
MHRLALMACVLTATGTWAPLRGAIVEFEMMTGPELQHAIHEEGKSTALIYNGGTEQRGPQNVTGGHTLMGRMTVKSIAEKLGGAIAAPVMPFSVNNADPKLPGTIGLTPKLFAAVNEQVAEQLINNGFKNIVLMGDHGGGQKQLEKLAAKLDRKYASQGIRIVFCGDVYKNANDDFDRLLDFNGYPQSDHAGVADTSEMLYLGGDISWVRKDLVDSAPGDQSPRRGKEHGDARGSTAALGKRAFDMKVDYAVSQIRHLLGSN